MAAKVELPTFVVLLDRDVVSAYQPYWAVRAHLLQRLGRTADASDAYDRAIGLAEDPAIRQFLLKKRDRFFSSDL